VSQNQPPALEVSGLSKSFGPIRALDAIELTVQPGELVVLLGPNGAGKSTLLQLLTGLLMPDAGTIRVCGHDLRTELTTVLSLLGIVFQQSTLDLELSVRENLRFHADLHGLPRSKAAAVIEESLLRYGLLELAQAPIRTISGGNRRRVELARALLHSPRVLIMDEATVGLDPVSRRDILRHILELRGRAGVAVLWATHLIDEAGVADRVLVLHKGGLVFGDSAKALAARHSGNDLNEAFLQLTALP
jgi:ABC-2 type transport system ATP-binding protein